MAGHELLDRTDLARAHLQHGRPGRRQVSLDHVQAEADEVEAVRAAVDRRHRVLGVARRRPPSRPTAGRRRSPRTARRHRAPRSSAPRGRRPGSLRGPRSGEGTRRRPASASTQTSERGASVTASSPMCPAPEHSSSTGPGGAVSMSSAAHRDCSAVHRRGSSTRSSYSMDSLSKSTVRVVPRRSRSVTRPPAVVAPPGRRAGAAPRRCARPAAGPGPREAPAHRGPSVACSSIDTSVSAPTGDSRSVTVARPAGQACACRTSRTPGSHSTDSVSSSISSGQVPTEWWRRAPTAGQASSTSRIRDAPTTHRGRASRRPAPPRPGRAWRS